MLLGGKFTTRFKVYFPIDSLPWLALWFRLRLVGTAENLSKQILYLTTEGPCFVREIFQLEDGISLTGIPKKYVF
jgi:hypothetical protein